MKLCIVLLFAVVLLSSCGEKTTEQQEPTIYITSPADSAKVFEITNITAEASDDKGVAKVEFYIDASLKATDVQAPYSYSWNTTSCSDSSFHTIFARAYDTDDNIAGSELITVMVDNSLGRPNPVVLNPASEITASTMLLTWSENTNDDFAIFKVFRSLGAGVTESSEQLATIHQDTTTSYPVSGLQENEGYHFRVFTYDVFGHSSGSNEVMAKTLNIAPRVSTLQLCPTTPATESSVPVCWSRNTNHDFISYRLYRLLTADVDTNSTLIFETQNVGETAYTDTGLAADTKYYYRVYVYDTGQIGSGSNIVGVTTLCQGPMESLWEVTRGLVILGHSTLDCCGQDIRDMFGGTFSTNPVEVGNVVFDDAPAPGFVDFVEWQTPWFARISSFTLTYRDDGPGLNWRNLAHFTLRFLDETSGGWVTVYSADTPQHVGAHTITASINGPVANRFRAEFTRGPASASDSDAPRIIELDGFGCIMSAGD
ncbi:MAG: Ig-like domain-containing protein [Candidatus Eisenbacteria bacterium]